MTVVLDYGINNISSVVKAIDFLGHRVAVQPDLAGASKLVIPGVGAFGRAMERLDPIANDIRKFADDGHFILGICLGQQLLFDSSEEFGSRLGLGLVPGRVKYFSKDMGLKVPHVGWSKVDFRLGSVLGAGVSPGERFYFVHSLMTLCEEQGDVAAFTSYGTRFASAVQHGNVFGTQFHPEKSGKPGLQVLRNFLEC